MLPSLTLCRLCGWVAVSDLSKGFGLATQEPWIQCATIRDNVLFGKTFDAQLYREVLEACALNDDLSVSTWLDTLIWLLPGTSLTLQTPLGSLERASAQALLT